jgi:hypothetical protein
MLQNFADIALAASDPIRNPNFSNDYLDEWETALVQGGIV